MSLFDFFRKQPLSPEQFATLYVEALRSLGDTRNWVYEGGMDRLVPAGATVDGSSDVINLHNMRQDFLAASKDERNEVLKRQAMAMMQNYVPSNFEEARTKLRPVIRSTTERGVANFHLKASPQGRTMAFRPLCENMEIGIAYDGEFNIARLGEGKLKEWGVTFDEAYDVALDNLRTHSTTPFMALRNGVFASQFGDFYDASRLLLTDLLHRQPVAGAPVVMVPNRTVLLLTGDRNPEGLQLMLDIAMEERGKPRPLPARMLRWDGQNWRSFVPPGLEGKLRELRVQESLADYEDQARFLNQAHERDGIDIFVAKYMAFKGEGGDVISACTWTDGVHSLLPETDIVVLYRVTENQSAFVPWNELLKTCGDLLVPTGHLPARYEVREFPADEVFEALSRRFDKLKTTEASTA
jgi:uncharacterized protein YtpQ (UPF0354 family)